MADSASKPTPEGANPTRVIAPGYILGQGAKRWIVTLVQTRWVWVLDHPTPDGQVAIPLDWAAVNKLRVVRS